MLVWAGLQSKHVKYIAAQPKNSLGKLNWSSCKQTNHMFVYVSTNMYIYIYTDIQIYIYTHIHMYICTYIYIYTYIPDILAPVESTGGAVTNTLLSRVAEPPCLSKLMCCISLLLEMCKTSALIDLFRPSRSDHCFRLAELSFILSLAKTKRIRTEQVDIAFIPSLLNFSRIARYLALMLFRSCS